MPRGFAFGPLVKEEVLSFGRLTILQARMNPDLAVGDELATSCFDRLRRVTDNLSARGAMFCQSGATVRDGA